MDQSEASIVTMTTNQRPVSPGDPAEGDGEAWLLGLGGAGRGVATHYVHKLGAPPCSHIALLTLIQVMALSSPHTEHSGVATHSGLVPTNLQTQHEINSQWQSTVERAFTEHGVIGKIIFLPKNIW